MKNWISIVLLPIVLHGETSEHTFRILGLFEPSRTEELRGVIETIPNVSLIHVDYDAGEATFAIDTSVRLPHSRKGEEMVVSFDRVLRQSSGSNFEALPKSAFPHAKRQKMTIPIAGLDCRGCSYGAYLAVCKLDGIERAIAKMGENGELVAWINPEKIALPDLEAELVKKRIKTNYRLEGKGLVPPEEMKIVRFSSQETRRGIKRLANHAIDGDVVTFWRTEFLQDPVSPHPHELVIDLGKIRRVSGIRYLAKQLDDAGQFAKTEFYVSKDPEVFGDKPAASAEFISTKAPQSIDCAPQEGRFVMVRILSEVNEKPSASAAEIGVMEINCPSPDL